MARELLWGYHKLKPVKTTCLLTLMMWLGMVIYGLDFDIIHIRI
jgi:hypothetical protein